MTESIPLTYQQRKQHYDNIRLKPHQEAAKERNRVLRDKELGKQPQEKTNDRR